MKTLENFKTINDNMLWRRAALEQVDAFISLASRLSVKAQVVGSHTSKSIDLPVVRFKINGTMFFLRDNFYDTNICVRAKKPITLSYADFLGGACPEYDWAWYLNEIARCRGYTWHYFTDEEMDDPQILSVKKPHEFSGNVTEWSRRPDEKKHWLKRMSNPEWWMRHWAGGMLCWEGEFGPGVKLFRQSHPFMEGIGRLVPEEAMKPYQLGKSEFALAVENLETAELIIRRVSEHLK